MARRYPDITFALTENEWFWNGKDSRFDPGRAHSAPKEKI